MAELVSGQSGPEIEIRVSLDGPYVVANLPEFRNWLGEELPHKPQMELCRCGQSANKPFCDGSHHEVGFNASGEPPSGKTDMLPVRDGVLAVDPQTDGPLKVSGNLEIISGTGRVVARTTTTWLCRCGASKNKPFCDSSHKKIGFKAP